MSGTFTLTGTLLHHDKTTPHADAAVKLSSVVYPDVGDAIIYTQGASVLTDGDGTFSVELLTETDLYYTVVSDAVPPLFPAITFLAPDDGETHDLSEFTTTEIGAVTPSVLTETLAAAAEAAASADAAAASAAVLTATVLDNDDGTASIGSSIVSADNGDGTGTLG